MRTKIGMAFAGACAAVFIAAGPAAAEPAPAPTPVPYSTVEQQCEVCDQGNTESGTGGAPSFALPRLSSMVPWPLSQLLSMIGM